jgi:hypothetical protein
VAWHFKNRFRTVAEFFFHLNYRGDHLSGLLDEDSVANADVFSLNLLLVVKRGAGHGAA